MHPMLNMAMRAARKAGDLIMRYAHRVDSLNIAEKQRHDYVTEVDRAAEQVIIDVLRKAYPEHGILAEESGSQEGENAEYLWIIDPLDGTTNFLHGFPQFAVSIALQFRGKLDQAVVYDPSRSEMFTASRGAGMQVDGRRHRVTKQRSLDGALIGTGFPPRQREHLEPFLAMLQETLKQPTDGIRRAGSAALDLAYVAAGRLDAFWEIGLNRWDMAAGALLIQEAGGIVTDFDGGDRYLESGNIVVGNPKTHHALLQIVKSFRGPHLSY